MAAGLTLSAAPGVNAQTAGTVVDQAERIQRQQRERLEEERRRLQEEQPRTKIQRPAPPEPPEGAADQPCRDVDTVRIEGASLLSDADIESLSRAYRDRCVSVSDIERLMSDITGLYIRRGYIAARAYVQAQDLSQGVLRILVMEGEVEDVRLREGQEGSANLGNAFPGVKGEPLNLRDFEQGLDQINRLRSNRAVLDMAPGEQAGDTVVVIDNTTDRRVHGSLSYDNHGLGSTGEEQVGATLAVDNPLGQNDGLNLSFSRTVGHDFDQRHSRSGALFYSVPYGYFTFTGGYSRSDYATPVELPGTTLISDGNQDSAFFSTDYVAYRDQVNRVSISGTLTARRSHNYLAGQLLEVSSRRLSSFDLGVRWSTSVAGGRLSSHLSYVRGLTWFNAQEDRSDLPDTAPRAQFSKWRAGLSWQRGLRLGGKLFSFRSTLEGQYAEDVLYGAHQFSVGGLYSVRGFRNSSLAGDRGYYWRNELGLPMRTRWLGQSLGLRPFIGFDTGEVLDHYQREGGHLAGAALGLDVNHRHLRLRILGTKPVSMPARLRDEDYEVFATITLLI